MSKHTPGPWRVQSGKAYMIGTDKVPWLVNAGNRFVDECEKKANARLIAAAPEMLKALKRVMTAIEHSPGCFIGVLPMQDAERAIAKAEGKR